MRVALERTGGLAGARRSLRLAPPSLGADAEERLRAAAARAGFFALPPRLPSAAPRPDAFRYRLAIEDGDRRHQVEFAEPDAGDALLSLVEAIEAAAEGAPP